jgi:nickel-dependent lactate racemase
MRVGIDYGLAHLDVEVPEGNLVSVERPGRGQPLRDPAAAIAAALEAPLGFPALRRALTPDDHVAIVVDESLPQLPQLLTPVLEHITRAHVSPAAIALVCPRSDSRQQWVEELPEAFEEVQVEVHDPCDRRRLAYLATMRQGRRLYLNRTAVDADQLVVLGGRRYDPLLGYSGSEGALYPALCDESTRQELCSRLSMAAPAQVAWPVRQEAIEAAWLLGAPFIVQVIEGAGDEVLHVLAGMTDTAAEGERLLDARWRLTVAEPADVVLAGISGNPARHGFADLARALACAARVVKVGGRIVLLSQAQPHLGPGSAILRQAGDAAQALQLLQEGRPVDMAAAFQWASAAQKAHIYLLSDIPAATAEELLATPLDGPAQVQRLLEAGTCLVIDDAHKSLAITRP